MPSVRMGFALSLLSLSALVSAHTHLEKSVPADGSTLHEPPRQFILAFAKPARVTAASLQREGGAAEKLGPLPDGSAREVSIPAPALSPGRYILTWRAMSEDGHVMPGRITFTLAPSGGGTPPPTSGTSH